MTGTCESCGAENVLAEARLAPGIVVNLCEGRHHAPKLTCLRKAWEAAKCCPGCGQDTHRPNLFAVCAGCRSTLDRNAIVDDVPKLYAVDPQLLSSHYPSGKAGEAATQVVNALVRLAAAKGPRRQGRDVPNAGWYVPVLSSDKHQSAHTSMPRVELDDDQRDALVELGELVRRLVDAMYLQGRKDGRDLLNGLAEGRISPNDFTDRDLRWRAEEEKKRGD